VTSPIYDQDRLFEQGDGANCYISFNTVGSGPNSVRVRARQLGYNWEVVATESHARMNRAMYPHSRAVGKFFVTLEFKGYNEFRAFSQFMFRYIKMFMGTERRSMLVSCPVRGFSRWGIPVGGIYDGDHIGSMVIAPTIIFEGMQDPLDFKILTGTEPTTAQVDMAGARGDQAKFFFPFSEGSRNANTTPETLYNGVNDSEPGRGITNAINNALGNVAGSALDAVGRYTDDQRRNGG
jgi:hypothetical protein